jgi:hypothetical protein
MAKSYEPGLVKVLKAFLRYAQRWQSKLQGSLTESQYACLVATIAAALDCLAAIGELPLND